MECRQVIWAKINFISGDIAEYERPFLVIGEEEDYLITLNCGSIKRSNLYKMLSDNYVRLKRHRPPFNVKTFVQVNEIYKVPKVPEIDKAMKSTVKLDERDFNIVMDYYNFYDEKNNQRNIKIVSEEEFKSLNPELFEQPLLMTP
ncbi:hypothetical protein N2W44_000377 [Clostridium perfringens]|uniref:hypothetical protein n=1 Tax=Clostridium perfringens TaxID=1502 RepID=UPI00189B7EC5|nr:hypothetical protein [Clostridium perfringens]EJT6473308.1 hypothetical protein [Clostridium perfringens]EJT6478855.1 hypothetical protein [Clostridium perfringens]